MLAVDVNYEIKEKFNDFDSKMVVRCISYVYTTRKSV